LPSTCPSRTSEVGFPVEIHRSSWVPKGSLHHPRITSSSLWSSWGIGPILLVTIRPVVRRITGLIVALLGAVLPPLPGDLGQGIQTAATAATRRDTTTPITMRILMMLIPGPYALVGTSAHEQNLFGTTIWHGGGTNCPGYLVKLKRGTSLRRDLSLLHELEKMTEHELLLHR
jgi:hypothetical protein